MTRLMAALTVLTLTSSGLHQWDTLDPVRKDDAPPGVRDVCVPQRPEEADRPSPEVERETARRFTAVANVSLNQLHTEQIRLDEACDRLLFYSAVHYPDYLVRLGRAEQGQSLREKIGLDLVRKLRGHLLSEHGPRGGEAAALSRLENELHELRRAEAVRLARRSEPAKTPARPAGRPDDAWDSNAAEPMPMPQPSGMS